MRKKAWLYDGPPVCVGASVDDTGGGGPIAPGPLLDSVPWKALTLAPMSV